MIGMLGGNEDSVNAYNAAVGKTISALSIDDKALRFDFADGAKLTLSDEGQSCCEHRYMRTDDDLKAFVGATFLGAEVKEAPPIVNDFGDAHEVAFLDITTDRGVFQIANHNEHNGYYGGFLIRAS